jgi:hypothetical protein
LIVAVFSFAKPSRAKRTGGLVWMNMGRERSIQAGEKEQDTERQEFTQKRKK